MASSSRADVVVMPGQRRLHPGHPRSAAAGAAATLHRLARGLGPEVLRPMLAVTGAEVPGPGWVFEPKYDGVRVLAFVDEGGVKLVTRNGADKAAQFPEVCAALGALRTRGPLVIDGEVVAVEGQKVLRFQALQGRMHLKGAADIERASQSIAAALIAFDLLVDGGQPLLDFPLSARRARLDRLLGPGGRSVRPSQVLTEGGERLLARARRQGWEGLMAKRLDAPYRPGARSDAWRKLKVEWRQEFVVGGFTEPRRSRPYLGALLLGYYDRGRLVYAGHMGGGFTHEGLRSMRQRLDRLLRARSPFAEPPRANEQVHWVKPEVVVEVKFMEWTGDGKLRMPILVGVRDDKDPREVRREPSSVAGRAA